MAKFQMSFPEWIHSEEHGFIINDLWDTDKNVDGGTGKLELLYPWDVILEYALKQDERGVFPCGTVVLSAPKKSAKALDINTPILTVNGWKTMEHIHAGDMVFSDDGNYYPVSHATDIMYNHKCYEVEFSNGDKIIADAEHVWRVGSRIYPGGGTKIDNALYWHDTTTEEMVDKVDTTWGKNPPKNYSIRITKGLNFPAKDLPISPYTFGLWLGDGTSNSSDITCSSEDLEELLYYIKEDGYFPHLHLSRNRAPTIRLSDKSHTKAEQLTESVRVKLRELGVLGHKHIPDIYKFSSYEQRMELLRGLMDSDGTISMDKGRCVFSNCNEELVTDVQYLLHSLGIKGNIVSDPAKIYGREVGTHYRINFMAYLEVPVFKLLRKVSRMIPQDKSRPRSSLIRINAIREVETVPVKCIQVDSPNHLYLAGKTLIPTHNTTMSAAVTAWYAECAPEGTEIFICANSEEQSVRLIFKDLSFHFKHRGGSKVLKDRIELENGTVIQVLTRNYTSNAGGRHALVVFDELWGGCLSADTLCYTADGWKSYDQIVVGEQIATINPDTLMFEWQPVKSLSVFDYDGDMYQLNHRRGDILATPNHRVFGKFRSSGHISLNDPKVKYEFLKAEDAVQMFEGRLSVEAGWKGNGHTTYYIPACDVPLQGSKIGTMRHLEPREYPAERFLEFMGYYLAEGNVCGYKERPSSIFIAQMNKEHPEVVQAMDECFSALGFNYVKNNKGFRIKEPQIAQYLKQFGHAHEKFVPEILKDYDAEYLSAFFEAFIDGDGWINGNIQTEISSKQLLDDLVEISLKIGYTPRYMGSRMRSHIDKRDGRVIANKYPSYRASFSTGNMCYHRKNWETVHYKGRVWCPSVDNKTWLSNRNGNICWTGNTSEDDYRRYDEMTPVPMIPHSLQLITSYAGFLGESNLLYDIFKKSVGMEDPDQDEPNGAVLVPELAPLPCWRTGNAYFAYWDHEPRMPWQLGDYGDKYYKDQRDRQRDSAFIRQHENRWVTSNEMFFPIEWWDYAIQSFADFLGVETKDVRSADLWKGHPFIKNPVYVAVDTGMKHDCTAIVGVTADAKVGKVIPLFHKIWTPVEGETLDLEETVEPYLIKAGENFNIVDITCDPSQMLQVMTKLTNLGLPISEFTQSDSGMIAASQALFDVMHDKNLWAYPAEDLREHLQNAVAQHTSRGFRIVKDKSNRRTAKKKVDGAVAMAMAVYKAIQDMDFDAGERIRIESPFAEYSESYTNPGDELLPWQLRG